MRLLQIDIENFRRLAAATVHFSPSTFIVGPNNTGKSSIIAAIEALLSLEKGNLSQADILEHSDGTRAGRTTITAYFGDIPADVAASRGFRGRVVNNKFVYRKSLTSEKTKATIETQEYPSTPNLQFAKAKTVKDLLDGGIPEDAVKDALGGTDPETKLPKDWQRSIPDALEFDTTAEPTWVQNPGGIPQNVLSRLPRLIHIPALTDSKEIESDEKRFALGECLSLLFEDLIGANPLAEDIETKLKELEGQMNPADDSSLVHRLVKEINTIIADVFPRCGIAVTPSLQNLLEILRPKYDIKVFSNIHTGAARQGAGLIRTCAFAMLRYHARLKFQKELQTRPILVAFEEPELFLHPSAANLLRDTIYALGQSDQTICTTHSPWMIDLSRDLQSVTRTAIGDDDSAVAINYGVSSALGKLAPEDRDRVKVVQVFDDELSRVFFAERVVVVEGDSEILAIRNTVRLLPDQRQKAIAARYQLVKARGKAAIISLVRYLRELHIDPVVIHDGDYGVAGAEVFNGPIANAVGNPDAVIVLDRCLEEVLGYAPPSSDKPYHSFIQTAKWKSVDEVPAKWMDAVRSAFADVMDA
jgi:predicted ATP-binding protein involved in virulence